MYLDSAILVKLLVREADSEWFDRHLAGYSLDTSELALTEVRSALLAKERNGNISAAERLAAQERFRSLVEDKTVQLLALNRNVLERASEIQLACHPRVALRALDALHVATCELNRCRPMCATDARMRAACTQLAIALFPPSMEQIGYARTPPTA